MAKRVRWYPDSAPFQSGQFRLHGHGRDDVNGEGFVDRPGGSGDYLFAHFTTATCILDGEAVREHPAHTLIVFAPGHRQIYGHQRAKWNHWWLHCHGESVVAALGASRIPLNRAIADADPQAADRAIAGIEREMLRPEGPDFRILECHLRIWVREIDRRIGAASAPPSVHPGIARALQHMVDRLGSPQALPVLARMAGLSVSRFSAAFQARIGDPPMRHLLRLRLERAAELLLDRNRPIAEVAREVGFTDPFYFTRQFTRVHGASPRSWRQRRFALGAPPA